MKSNQIKYSLILLFIVITLFSIAPRIVTAESVCCDTGSPCTEGNQCSNGVCGGLCNPLGDTNLSVVDLAVRVLQIALGIVGLFGVVMFIYGGFIMLTSAGNPDKVKKAKDTLVWAVLGLTTIFVSGTVVRYLFDNFKF